MILNKKVTKEELIRWILTIMNFELKLSELEVNMLVVLLHAKITTLDSDARNIIRSILNKDKFAVNNYIKRLKDKRILLQEDKTLVINPNIVKLVENKELNFKFEIKD